MIPLVYTKADIGGRPYMEDRHTEVSILKDIYFAGVYDGHGGDQVANICATNFHNVMMQGLHLKGNDIACVIRSTFFIMDHLVSKLGEALSHVGSTVVICLVMPNALWFANAGDSMTMVEYIDGTVEFMSEEHKVENEKARIEAEGGVITYDDGCARVFRTLNVSRAIGDHFMKKHVNCNPYVRSISRNFSKVKYVVLASDGIWDVMKPKDVSDIIKKYKNVNKALEHIVDIAKFKGSTDNITITYIDVNKHANRP